VPESERIVPDREPEQHPILVVDDDDALRRLFAVALRRAGFEALEARDGREALAVIADRPVSLVLLDSMMPGMDGAQVIAALRAEERTRALPIIMVTALAQVSDRVRGLEAGADDYLTKPVHLDELVARVRAQLRSKAAWTSMAIERDLAARATVASALGRLRAGESPEDTAEAICAELAGMSGVDLVSVVSLGGEDVAVPLATRGRFQGPLRAGAALPRPLARYLRERASGGPWTEPLDGQGRAAGEVASIGVEAAACAPLLSGGELLGVLIVGTDPARAPHDPDDAQRRLSATIDFSAIAAALLAPTLADRAWVRASRDRLERIISTRAFWPVFQPIVDLERRRVTGYEALTRFEDGARPDLRFAEAARFGLGLELEVATLAAAVDAARKIPEKRWLGINVSPALVLQGDPLSALARRANRDLVLELSEHEEIEDYAKLGAALERLQPLLRLSVDDAGAGFASLRHIVVLRPAFLKLDLSLVRDIDRDPARQAIVAGLCRFAVIIGGRVVAEGIETEAELAALSRLEVDLGQGYLLGRPSSEVADEDASRE
jgi:EAL domain-containing protein (putative c-di-GMP-specific phosphodiesterase class I)/CheY-like chemotaxis protein